MNDWKYEEYENTECNDRTLAALSDLKTAMFLRDLMEHLQAHFEKERNSW